MSEMASHNMDEFPEKAFSNGSIEPSEGFIRHAKSTQAVSQQAETIENIRSIDLPEVMKKSLTASEPEFVKPFDESVALKPETDSESTNNDSESVNLTKNLDDLQVLLQQETAAIHNQNTFDEANEVNKTSQLKTEDPSEPTAAKEEALNRILHPVDIIDEKRKQLEERMRQMALYQQRRAYKKQLIRYKRLGFLTKLTALPLTLFAIVFLLQQPFWMITNIDQTALYNNKIVTFNNLKPLINQVIDKPLYLINPQTLSETIKQHFPIIEEVEVRRHLFPARLAFYMTEKPVYAELYELKFQETKKETPYALMGYNHESIPLALYKYQPGKTLSYQNVAKIKVHPAFEFTPAFSKRFSKLAFQLNHLNGFNLQTISLYPSPKDKTNALIEATFDEGHVLLGQLDSETPMRLERLLPLRDTLIKNKEKLRWVDLRWGEQVTLRKK